MEARTNTIAKIQAAIGTFREKRKRVEELNLRAKPIEEVRYMHK
jgi:hypothetical protein